MRYRMTVIGTGYLGITHAACMAALGYEVLGLDIDVDKIRGLNQGELPIYEEGLGELLRAGLASGKLRFTTSYEEAGEFGDVHFLCLGTPQRAGGFAADVSQIDSALAALTPWLSRPSLVVGKSTVPVGTARRLADGLPEHVELAWNPEFLREGFAVEDTLHPDRIVLGVASDAAERVLREVYAPLGDVPLVVTDYATAELVKVAANAFLATKISYINAMAEVCEAAGADVVRLAEALGHDTRIGRRFLGSGLGFGGGCLPKDIRAFAARADELGVPLTFLREVDAINTRRRHRTVDLARELVGGSFTGRRVAVLGAAFKPNSDDIRDSPALDVALAVHRAGGLVSVHDPAAMDNARKAYPVLGYAPTPQDAIRDADVVLLLTEWQEFTDLDPTALGTPTSIVDARNALDPHSWQAAGWTYRALGRPALL
ncbi:UDP-glucose dehydrogenase family protein [Actinokineospora cianjurensis]|uniref:UDP-glucose 6-dehydrogenase n=1 Tax=Actinokineospora cianjurensis TaxID=585224 RepID=A0A421BAU6_9PSEU|nr:UDP-glucose/GDP-mannose dehydrogenase family protein [Actinokineospora cianjurensis]RLK61435.1 UDPglucose 6-dehydrogenase [Actinokineospora cianjurensis]